LELPFGEDAVAGGADRGRITGVRPDEVFDCRLRGADPPTS
jgi:hypothetical protein